MLTKDFYRAFEERHRGSRTLIKNRISVYLPFVLPLNKIYHQALALDIGCGRGEWIELLSENDILAQGVDLDEGMLEACHKLQLDVLQKNGIIHLQEQKDESLIVISAFHVVEHISFEDLQLFVQESLRVLKPGGILIMETPNPENIKVATENFYLDPTHIKPIPLKLLSFFTEFYGYTRTKVVRLQENKNILNQQSISLLDVLGGVSPDYAVVAQKSASEDILEQFEEVFAKEYGLPLSVLAEKFENRLLTLESRVNQAEANTNEVETKLIESASKVNESEVRANEYLNLYNIAVNSNSWKLTKPLRFVGKGVRWFMHGSKAWLTFSTTSRPRRVLKQTLISLKHRINAKPKLKLKVMQVLSTYPNLEQKLKNMGKIHHHVSQEHSSRYDTLLPEAMVIYDELKASLNVKMGKN